MHQNKNIAPSSDMRHVFQPIYHLKTWLLYGYESFLRIPTYLSPTDWFKAAGQKNKLVEMDLKSLYNAIRTFTSTDYFRKSPLLFINIFPSTLVSHSFRPLLEHVIEEFKLSSKHIILEINEDQPFHTLPLLKQHVQSLQRDGFSIALDNIGTNFGAFKTVIELEPKFIKIDHYFADNLSQSNKKQRFIQLMAEYVQDDAHLILGGIEQPADLAISKTLGIDFGQGYVFGNPPSF